MMILQQPTQPCSPGRSHRWPHRTCDDTFSLVSLVSAGLGVGFAPEWTADLPGRNVELRTVRGIDFKIGLGVAWNTDDPTTARDDIVDIARSLVRRESSNRKVEAA
jgi:DNA-binding transcriptional LysR family regulator